MLCDAVLMWAEMCSVVLVVRWGGSSRDICRWRVERLVPATHCHTVRPQLRERYSHYCPLLLQHSPVRANPSLYPVTPSPLQSVWRGSDQPSSPLEVSRAELLMGLQTSSTGHNVITVNM